MKTAQALNYTKKLISISSDSGNEQAISSYIQETVATLGSVQTIEQSVVLHIVGKDQTKALIFNGHIDTVPAGSSWQTQPLTAVEKNGKLYGLGASDMKSGVGIMLQLANDFANQQPPCDMWFMFVEQEETDGRGTKKVLDVLPDFTNAYPGGVEGFILEPTNSAYVAIGHKGNIFVTLTFDGQGGHGSMELPYQQRASHKAAHFIQQLPRIAQSWKTTYTHAILGEPTINVTNIESVGSKALNAVPQSVIVSLDIRTTPELSAQFTGAIDALAATYGATYSYPYKPNGYGLCSEDSQLLAIAKKQFAVKDIRVFQGASDQLFFTANNIPMLIYGPGTDTVMHQPNEYVEISAIDKTYNVLQSFIAHFTD